MADKPFIDKAVKDVAADPTAFHADVTNFWKNHNHTDSELLQNVTAFVSELQKNPAALKQLQANRALQEDVRELFELVPARTNYVGVAGDLKDLDSALSQSPEVKRILGDFHLTDHGLKAQMTTHFLKDRLTINFFGDTYSFDNGGLHVAATEHGGWKITEGGRDNHTRNNVNAGKPNELAGNKGSIQAENEALHVLDGDGKLLYTIVQDSNGRPTIYSPDGKVVPYTYHDNRGKK